ncbi:MAG: SEL1-like repeat protein [Gammaproteobacteria bacterium]
MEPQITLASSAKRYRPLFRRMEIGSHCYAVMDEQLASERAEEHLRTALYLLDSPSTPEIQQAIDRELKLALDFGCADAPYLLANRILQGESTQGLSGSDALSFLQVAAERGHSEAAYRLGCSYGAMENFPDVEMAGAQYFNRYTPEERCRMAERYFDEAIALGYEEALEELVLAYAYGRGYIEKDSDCFMTLCEAQVKAGNQSVTMGYGAWLAGMTVDGEKPLEEAVKIPINIPRAFEYLFLASRGNDLEYSQHALHLLVLGITQSIWTRNWDRLARRFMREADNQHYLLALYMGYYAIPVGQRPSIDAEWMLKYPLTDLTKILREDHNIAARYLEMVHFGPDERLAAVANELMACLGYQGQRWYG